jgi:catechol 2,3-dioxygenase-like lactoylglutathione lyase family enzyme
MADFYGRLLGWEVTFSEPRWVLMRDPSGGTGLSFQAESGYREPSWPEQASGQDKMLHLDIKVDDLDAAVQHALASGARLAEYQPQEPRRAHARPRWPSVSASFSTEGPRDLPLGRSQDHNDRAS